MGTSVSGFVKSIAVSGIGPNSAEIVIAFGNPGNETAYAVYAPPSTEPSVFTSFATLLTAAYLNKTRIDLTYVVDADHPTPIISEVVIPSEG